MKKGAAFYRCMDMDVSSQTRCLFDIGHALPQCKCCKKRPRVDGQKRCERCIRSSQSGNGGEMRTVYGLSDAWVNKIENTQSGLRQRAKQNGHTEWARRNDLSKLLSQQGFRCAITGELLNPDKTTVLGHNIPASRGGRYTSENLMWITKEANRLMGTRTAVEFVELCAAVVRRAR